MIWVGGGQFFRRIFFLIKPITTEYAKVLVVTWAKLNSVSALLSPRPTVKVQSIQALPKGPWYKKVLEVPMSLKGQRSKVPKVPGYPKSTYGSKVSKRYLKVQAIQKLPKGPRYPRGT